MNDNIMYNLIFPNQRPIFYNSHRNSDFNNHNFCITFPWEGDRETLYLFKDAIMMRAPRFLEDLRPPDEEIEVQHKKIDDFGLNTVMQFVDFCEKGSVTWSEIQNNVTYIYDLYHFAIRYGVDGIVDNILSELNRTLDKEQATNLLAKVVEKHGEDAVFGQYPGVAHKETTLLIPIMLKCRFHSDDGVDYMGTTFPSCLENWHEWLDENGL